MELLLESDVVISSCRARALEQLEIEPAEVVSANGGIWAGITGHGLFGSRQNRVAFGDDAAVAGGLVWTAGQLEPGKVSDAECGVSDSGLAGSGLADSGLAGFGLSGSGLSNSGLSNSGLSNSGLANSALPCFLGDALADPITGVFTAAAILGLWPHTSGVVLDISMAGVASHLRIG